MGKIKAENLIVECYHGPMHDDLLICEGQSIRMEKFGESNGTTNFKGKIKCDVGGKYGYTVRVLPGHKNLAVEYLPGLVKWFE